MSAIASTVGFIGLGNMGRQLAANLVASGFEVAAYDTAGAGRLPDGADFVADVADVARRADIVLLSLPDGRASETVAREILAADGRRASHLVETSTVGPRAAEVVATLLAEHGVAYVDAPVSGGVAGAQARTLTVMYSAPDGACAHVGPVLAGLSDRLERVGERAGLAQAMKLANNFLSATALAATSEAIAFGLAAGLEMGTMLEVLSGSSGCNSATTDKFPNHVLTGRYAAGFSNSLMSKDVHLYLRAAEENGGPTAVGTVVASIWARFVELEPGVDFTRVFPFIDGSH